MPLEDNLSGISWTEQKRKAYEVWYGMVAHPDYLKSFWFRYSLLARENSPPEGRLWAIYFDEEGYMHHTVSEKQFVLTKAFPWSEIQLDSQKGGVSFGPHYLNHQGAKGEIEGDGFQASWDFTWEPNPKSHQPVANNWIYKLASKSIHLTPNGGVRFQGELRLKDQTLKFENAPGHQGHTYGTEMPLGWVWAQCAAFKENKEASFEGVALYKKKSHPFPPAMNSFFVHYEGKDYAFNRLKNLRKDQSQGTLPLWNFEAKHSDLWIKGNMRLRAAKFAQVAYLAPDDSFLFNHNDCLSQIELFLFHPGEEKPFQTLTSEKASLEFVFREGSRADFTPQYDI